MRFNIEDSIVKQFKLKCAVAINSQNSNVSLEDLSASLSEIYNQRSDIAHGNYVDNYSTDTLVKSVLKLFEYLRDIVNAYIDKQELIEYLKDN
jgi:hypothetical protein